MLVGFFTGTGSAGRAFRVRGWEVFSVDIDASAEPTLVAEVLHLQPADLPTRVGCVWASPPCTRYSRTRTRARTPRDLDGSDALVRKVLSVIDRYGGPDWFMADPQTDLLKSREEAAGLPMRAADYCKHGKPDRKRTPIWASIGWVLQRPLCMHNCPASDGARHTATAQGLPCVWPPL